LNVEYAFSAAIFEQYDRQIESLTHAKFVHYVRILRAEIANDEIALQYSLQDVKCNIVCALDLIASDGFNARIKARWLDEMFVYAIKVP